MRPPILDHKLWPELRQYIDLQEATANAEGRVRLEFSPMPCTLAWAALEIRLPCVHCTDTIKPVRVHRGKSERSANVGGHCYLAVSCDWKTRLGCSRGLKAAAAYRAIREDVEQWRREHPLVAVQGELAGLGPVE